MRCIFLDIDGVVNCYDTKERAPSKVVGVEQRLIALIKQIVDATGAKLVLSSTWRKDWAFDLLDGIDWHYLVLGLIYLISGICWLVQARNYIEYIAGICGYACAINWFAYFYIKAREDSE